MFGRVAGFAVAMLLSAVCIGQSWESTRTTTYDYTCTDEAGKVLSGHQRLDSAFVACSNLSLKDGKARYVVGGRYKITAKAATVPPVDPPPVTTGKSTVGWTPSAQPAGMTLTGHRILYGTSPTALTQSVSINSPTVTSHVVDGLAPGTWYFAVRSVTSAGESANSTTASKVIQ